MGKYIYILRREYRKLLWNNKIYQKVVLKYFRKLIGLSYLDGGWHAGKRKPLFILNFPI